MQRNLLVMFLLAIILAMGVPYTMDTYQTENAFTYDNIISEQNAANATKSSIIP